MLTAGTGIYLRRHAMWHYLVDGDEIHGLTVHPVEGQAVTTFDHTSQPLLVRDLTGEITAVPLLDLLLERRLSSRIALLPP